MAAAAVPHKGAINPKRSASIPAIVGPVLPPIISPVKITKLIAVAENILETDSAGIMFMIKG